MQILLPQRLDFYRQAIELKPSPIAPAAAPAPAPTPDPIPEQQPPPRLPHRDRKQRNSSNTAAEDLLAARAAVPRTPEPSKQQQAATEPAPRRSIFGSVTTVDVAVAIRALLADNEEASTIVLVDEEVSFLGLEDESGNIITTDRVKHTGEFYAEVRLKGAVTVVRRAVRIIAQKEGQ